MADGDAKDSVSLLDRQYLTNVLREQAVKELPAKQGFTIMTRENINAMLPPGKAIEDCEGSCLAETGKNIAADYVCQARVGRFGSKLTLSAELYETAGNKLIASFNGRGDDVEKLLLLIESKSSEFFREIKDMNAPVATSTTDVIPDEQSHAIPDEKINVISGEKTDVIPGLTGNPLADSSSKVGESIPANVNDEPEKKSGIAGKVVFGISAAATVAGAILAVAGNSQAKKAAERNSDDLHRDLDDAKTGQTLRGVGIGVAIAGAVGIGLSFVF